MFSFGRTFTLLLAGTAVFVLAGCAGPGSNKAGGNQSKPVVLTLADGETDVSNAQPFADAVKRLSNGALQIEIKSPWRVTASDYEADLIKDVKAGKAQLGIAASRGFHAVGVDSFDALQAPFLINSTRLERKVLGSDLARRMLLGLKPAGLVGLAILPGPLRRPLSFSKPLLSVSDYRGKRIGIRPSRVSAEIVRALGATPVSQRRGSPSSGQVVSGLDGVESHVDAIASGFDVPHAALTGNVVFEPRANVIFINREAFDSLAPHERSVLLQAAAVARAATIYQPDSAGLSSLCQRHTRFAYATSADLARLRTAVEPVYKELESNASTKASIDEIRSIRRALGAPTDVVRCRAAKPTTPVSTSAKGLQGRWEVSYTQTEFNAAGATPDEELPVNWGYFTFRFDRGKWWNLGKKPGSSAAGTYVVRGNTITFYRHDHTYPGSDTEIWGPYSWSVYRDTLTFKKGHPFEGPTELVVKPWRRTGT